MNALEKTEAIEAVKNYFLSLQNQLCSHFEQIDGAKKFNEDCWTRSLGGGGRTRVLEGGRIFEKIGINFSHILGDQLPPAATLKRPELKSCSFHALGVSLVAHPQNPFIPTAHANVRFFIAEHAHSSPLWWFGGGFDLTPYYGFQEDCIHWHQIARSACEPFGSDLYPRFKQACDNYFFLKHRNEARGIGGLFFDDFSLKDFKHSLMFIQSIGDHFIPAYSPIVTKRLDMSYGERERNFQLYRRGRYVEFNLLYDRGTLFGLQSGGRTESILISLPPIVHWNYDYFPEKDSWEEKLFTYFLLPRNWADLSS